MASETQPIRYVIITPCRDEEAHLEKTIVSVINQTVRPARWIIVNDGSSDETPNIIDRYAKEHRWITRVDRENRGFRLNGSGVMEAFHLGYSELDIKDWHFLVKLDADLMFSADYFEACFKRFNQDQKLGIGGGMVASEIDGQIHTEKHPLFHVRGATKIYRRACWEDIGGLHPVKGWDTLDELKANLEGWNTLSFAEQTIIQKRFTGEAEGQLSNWRKNGEGCWIIGYHPLFLIARALVRGMRKPILVPTIGLLIGYFSAALRKVPHIPDRELVEYVRQQQFRKLTGRTSTWS